MGDRPTVLLVERDGIVGLWLEGLLTEAGYEVLGPFATMAEGMAALGSARVDLGLLSTALATQPTFALACALRRRGIPFVLVEGSTGLAPAFPGVRVLERPCRDDDLIVELRRASPASRTSAESGCPLADGPTEAAYDHRDCPADCARLPRAT